LPFAYANRVSGSNSTHVSHRITHKYYAPWIAPLLGLPTALSILTTLFAIVMVAADNNVSSDQRAAGAFIAIFFLVISTFLSIALVGIARSQVWGLGVATLAALLIALTGVGMLIAVPILWGLWAPRHSRKDAEAVDGFDPVEVRHALDHALKMSQRKLPDDIIRRVTKIRKEILALLPHVANFPTGSRDLFVIQRTATDYLPASLKAYLSLPNEYATSVEVEGDRTALQVLKDQLDLLDGKMGEIADAVRQQDAERLVIHGRFLQDQFENRSEELGLPDVSSHKN